MCVCNKFAELRKYTDNGILRINRNCQHLGVYYQNHDGIIFIISL